MIILITGATHTGKTLLAQKLLEKYRFPYLSIDHLKMGLIRSGQTTLTPNDDNLLTEYLWPIVKEIMKTAIENNQNLIIEGCYIPFYWKKNFTADELNFIRFICLIMTADYITEHFTEIQTYANIIERRIDDSYLTPEILISENMFYLKQCQKHGYHYLLIEDTYSTDFVL